MSLRATGRVLSRNTATVGSHPSRLSASLFESMTELVRKRCSSRQIAAHLAKRHPGEFAQRALPETIYRVTYAQPRGERRKEITACLRPAC
ncbi:MAG: hypothetical protein HHJ16_06280 [Polaromonas sp.]|uniref:hypothetical protein n=1 Tax=Polaromonas sp. TaxID=1869339 RepID=UPI0017B8B58D|nr:hypothetical protein [Polaromonas sp.]NMM09862.1 hypothetical protein [Polaromonas sp.]